MGTWGAKSFENDDALDFVDRLASFDSPAPIERVLKKANKSKSPDADLACHAVAAAELIALARGHGAKGVPENGRDWCDDVALQPSEPLVALAAATLERILENSELADLWQQPGEAAWRRDVKGLISRLGKKPKLRSRPPPPKPPAVKDMKRHLAAIRKAGSEVFLEKRRPHILDVQGRPTKEVYEHAAQLPSLRLIGLAGLNVKGKDIAPLANLPAVQDIDLQQSTIDEQAFRVLGKLATLEVWSFFSARFSGGAPRHLCGLRNLRKFDANHTPLTSAGLAAVSGSPNLEELLLLETQVTDSGMKHLAGLRKLEKLDLSKTRVGDAGLRHLTALKWLRCLDLFDTSVTGKGMKYLAELNSLRALNLACTHVDSRGMKYLAALGKLGSLDLAETEVTDSGLKHLAACKQLSSLSLAFCSISDAGLKAIAPLKKLTELYLQGTKIQGQGLEHLACRSLEELHLSSGAFADGGIRCLSRFPKLRELGLSNTRVSDKGFASPLRLPRLENIDLSDTAVGDATARALSGIETLTELDLSNTRLTDEGMAELVKLPALHWLTITGTQVSPAGIKLFGRHKSIWRIDDPKGESYFS